MTTVCNSIDFASLLSIVDGHTAKVSFSQSLSISHQLHVLYGHTVKHWLLIELAISAADHGHVFGRYLLR